MSIPFLHIPDVAGRKIAVLGLGKTGIPTVAALKASGARIWAWDDSESVRKGFLTQQELSLDGIHIEDLAYIDWKGIFYLVLSPGIPHTYPRPHPVVAKAKEAGTPILSDIELLYRSCPKAAYICVTGTNGKSTVTSLIGHILREAGKKVEIGGNLGQAALSLKPLDAGGVYVLELSSYQLEITPSAIADIALLLNITPDHIDRHGGFAGYAKAKKRIFQAKDAKSIAVIGLDDDVCRQIYDDLLHQRKGPLIGISAERPVINGIGTENGILIDPIQDACVDIRSIATLPGRHNWQNAAAAYAACLSYGLDSREIEAGLRSYPGLAHRQELVAKIGDISYVNDSKATNADAAVRALACYEDIYWIAGGQPKEGGLASLEKDYPRIRKAYLIGEAQDLFADQLKGKVDALKCGTLDRAFDEAHCDAQRAGKGIVLLSPACASWDQYSNFEARGEHFRRLAEQAMQTHQTKRRRA